MHSDYRYISSANSIYMWDVDNLNDGDFGHKWNYNYNGKDIYGTPFKSYLKKTFGKSKLTTK